MGKVTRADRKGLETILYEGGVWTFFARGGHEVFKLSNGVTETVMVIALDKNGRIVLVEKECPAINGKVLVLPGGKVERGEDIKVAAKREFEEETGLKVEDLNILGEVYVIPEYVEARTICFVGNVIGKGVRGGDDVVGLFPKFFSRGDIKRLIGSDGAKDVRTLGFLLKFLAGEQTSGDRV